MRGKTITISADYRILKLRTKSAAFIYNTELQFIMFRISSSWINKFPFIRFYIFQPAIDFPLKTQHPHRIILSITPLFSSSLHFFPIEYHFISVEGGFLLSHHDLAATGRFPLIFLLLSYFVNFSYTSNLFCK